MWGVRSEEEGLALGEVGEDRESRARGNEVRSNVWGEDGREVPTVQHKYNKTGGGGAQDPRQTGSSNNHNRAVQKCTETAPENVRTTSVLFVEQTKNGDLAKRLRGVEDRLAKITGYRVRVVERGGTQARHLLPYTNPWSDQVCGRQDCTTCKQGDEKVQNCFRTNILYESVCQDCLGKGDKSGVEREQVYVGESSRSIYERTKDHFEDFRRRKEDSHLFNHWSQVHGEQGMLNFKFRVVKSFKDALSRQIAESVRIHRRGSVLNVKGAYNRSQLPRMVVEDFGRKEKEDTAVVGEVEEEDSIDDVYEMRERSIIGSRVRFPKRKEIVSLEGGDQVGNEHSPTERSWYKRQKLDSAEGPEWGSYGREDVDRTCDNSVPEELVKRTKQSRIILLTEGEEIARNLLKEVLANSMQVVSANWELDQEVQVLLDVI